MSADLDVDAVRSAAEALLGESFTDVAGLGGSQRSLVLRATRPDGSTVIVKSFGEGQQMAGATPFQREREGLRSLTHTPGLVADDEQQRLIVMTDAGSHPTLADLLRGDDADAAWDGALRWARALGEVCGGSREVAPGVADRLAGSAVPASAGSAGSTGATGSPGATDDGAVAAFLERLPTGVAALGRAGGVAVPDAVGTEVDELAARLARPESRVASPGDTCPDNVLLPTDGSAPVFVDLEGTDVHPVAFDAAYALLPHPTCWCVYAAPEGFTDAMLTAFTDGLRATAPELVGSDWREEVLGAAVAWTLWMAPYLLDHTADPGERMGPESAPSLTMREHLLMRLRWLEQEAAPLLPVTSAWVADVARELERVWGELPTPTYPAFAICC